MSDHDWCRDVRRDEQVRAAEDAAAVPSIQHRDLPEQVALVWASLGDLLGRVVRLEGEMDAGQDEEAAPAVCDSASPAEGLRTERVTLEVTQRAESYAPLFEIDWESVLRQMHRGGRSRGESVRVVGTHAEAVAESVAWEGARNAFPGRIARLTAERDAAIRERDEARRERDEAREECERLLTMCAASPRGWLTAEERKAIRYFAATHEGWSEDDQPLKVIDALLARETPPRVRRPNPNVVITTVDARERIDRQWIDAIRAAGGEVE